MSDQTRWSELLKRVAGGLSGCGEESATGRVAGPEADEVVRQRADRLGRLDGLDGEVVGELLDGHERQRRTLLKAGGACGAMLAAAPLLSAASAAEPAKKPARDARAAARSAPSDRLFQDGGGRGHVIECTKENTRWGIFDTTAPPVLEIDPGDVISIRNTWMHYLDQLKKGSPLDQIVALRVSKPGVGPHSVLGPILVRDAEPGDVLEVQYLKIAVNDWGTCFNNPGHVGTGALADVFVDGQVRYLDIDHKKATAKFSDNIVLPVAPFQGILGVAPPDGFLPTPPGYAPGVVSSVPPGPHAGNVDCRDAVEGSRVFIPVFHAGAKIFTGDTHALQGDGEVNLSALETSLKEMRIRVLLHKRVGWKWPIHETPTAWLVHGMDKDLNLAFRTSLLNAIDFLNRQAGLSRLDAYALCSMGVSFRVTQVVNANKGVHGIIPKSIFQGPLRKSINVV
jgi:acetamidase/formamidase